MLALLAAAVVFAILGAFTDVVVAVVVVVVVVEVGVAAAAVGVLVTVVACTHLVSRSDVVYDRIFGHAMSVSLVRLVSSSEWSALC